MPKMAIVDTPGLSGILPAFAQENDFYWAEINSEVNGANYEYYSMISFVDVPTATRNKIASDNKLRQINDDQVKREIQSRSSGPSRAVRRPTGADFSEVSPGLSSPKWTCRNGDSG